MKDGKNNGTHLVTNMPDSGQMVFALRAFLLLKKADSRVFKSSLVEQCDNFAFEVGSNVNDVSGAT